MKNANPLLMLEASSWNVTPTAFQRSSFPAQFRNRISVIHDGIDTTLASPDPAVSPLTLPDGAVLSAGESTITFVNRRIEPYRGCLPFIRAIPAMQQACPDARIVIVGGHEELPMANLLRLVHGVISVLHGSVVNMTLQGAFPRQSCLRTFPAFAEVECLPRLSHLSLRAQLEFPGGNEHGIAHRWLGYCRAGGDS